MINPDERTHTVNAFGTPTRRLGRRNMLPSAAWTPACSRELVEVIRKMIRIMTADESELTMITVDGQLTGDCIQVVETSCDQARSNGKPIWLFLRDVSVIGEDGQVLLRCLAKKGVRLKASGIYTSYIVQSIQPDLCRGHAFVGESHADAPKR
jgi:hypothetical protein